MIDFTEAKQIIHKPKLWLYASTWQEALDKLPPAFFGDCVIDIGNAYAVLHQDYVYCVINVMTVEDWHSIKVNLTQEEMEKERQSERRIRNGEN